jgi:hypothetical protein
MRPISWSATAGLLAALSLSAAAQVPAVKTPPAVKAPVLVLVGTKAGDARRKALLGAIEDWKTFLPENPEAALTKKHEPTLHQIKDAASALKSGEAVDPVEKDFEAWKQGLLSELYEQNQERFFSDPARFSEFMQERLDTLSAIRKQKERAPKSVKRLDELKAKVNDLPDQATLDKIYNGVGASRTSLASAPIRLVSFTGLRPAAQAQPQALAWAPTAPPAPIHPDKTAVPPAVPVSFSQPESASSWSLSNIISSVSGTAKRYAGKVADAIVNFSKRFGLDEKLQAAIIWAESAFNPHATSEVGAMGLGQLMPGTAAGLGVSDAYDINQNVKGSSKFLKARLDHFTTEDDIKYMQGVYAWGADRVRSGESADAVWKDVFARTPLGVKNAIASYNAGQGAIDVYAHGNYMNLPRSRTAYAQAHNVGYWQTINYVPSVLKRYFDIQVKTARSSSPLTGPAPVSA